MSYLAESADVVSGEYYQRENKGCGRPESGLRWWGRDEQGGGICGFAAKVH